MKNRLMTVVLASAILAIAGCSTPQPQHQPSFVSNKITEPSLYATMLQFKVGINYSLSNGRTLNITAVSTPDYSDLGLDWNDTLTQPNGATVNFDCDNIADKIIQKELVKEITPLCKEGTKTLEAYWKSMNYTPKQFTDNEGNVWVRQNAN